MESIVSIIAKDMSEAGNSLWMVIFFIMKLFLPINKGHIAIQKMDLLVNKYLLNCYNKMLVFVFLTIILIVYKTKELFAILQMAKINAEFKMIHRIV